MEGVKITSLFNTQLHKEGLRRIKDSTTVHQKKVQMVVFYGWRQKRSVGQAPVARNMVDS